MRWTRGLGACAAVAACVACASCAAPAQHEAEAFESSVERVAAAIEPLMSEAHGASPAAFTDEDLRARLAALDALRASASLFEGIARKDSGDDARASLVRLGTAAAALAGGSSGVGSAIGAALPVIAMALDAADEAQRSEALSVVVTAVAPVLGELLRTLDEDLADIEMCAASPLLDALDAHWLAISQATDAAVRSVERGGEADATGALERLNDARARARWTPWRPALAPAGARPSEASGSDDERLTAGAGPQIAGPEIERLERAIESLLVVDERLARLRAMRNAAHRAIADAQRALSAIVRASAGRDGETRDLSTGAAAGSAGDDADADGEGADR